MSSLPFFLGTETINLCSGSQMHMQTDMYFCHWCCCWHRYHKKVLEHDNNLFVSFRHHLTVYGLPISEPKRRNCFIYDGSKISSAVSNFWAQNIPLCMFALCIYLATIQYTQRRHLYFFGYCDGYYIQLMSTEIIMNDKNIKTKYKLYLFRIKIWGYEK